MTPATASDALLPASRARSTLRALWVPRRALPVALVCGAMVFAQATFSRDRLAVPLSILLCFAFVHAAPLSWRMLLPAGLGSSPGSLTARFGAYLAIGASVVVAVGIGVPALVGMGTTFLTARVSLAVCLVLFWVGGWGLGRDIDNEEIVRRERSRVAALAREVELSQIAAIRAYLDPHFLFNTLNAIAEWCRQDGAVAEEAVLRLAGMLRSVLEGILAPSWPLEREVELVRGLLSMHLLREPALFRWTIEVDPACAAVPVPPMALLALAENAIKHGPARGHRGDIALSARIDGSALRIDLENPGSYGGPRPGSIGLPSLQRRLRLLYGDDARVDVSGAADRTIARLTLPVRGPRGAEHW